MNSTIKEEKKRMRNSRMDGRGNPSRAQITGRIKSSPQIGRRVQLSSRRTRAFVYL